MIKTVEERFWSKVNIKGDNDCWDIIAKIAENVAKSIIKNTKLVVEGD